MKKIVLLSFTFASLFANAQKVNVEVGKTFKVTSNIDGTSEMMGNENTSKVVTTTSIKIESLEKDLYKGSNTVTRMTMSGSMMGQEISFDSDKKEDMDGQMGQMLGAQVNKASNFTLDKNTGVFKTIKEESDGGGIGEMMSGGASSTTSIFYPAVIGKKLGDKWTENTEADGIKTINNYEVKSINGNVITVSLSGTTKGTTTKEMNGQSGEIALDIKTNSTISIDALTGIMKQITTEIEGTTNMDMGGQSMAISNKSKITTMVE